MVNFLMYMLFSGLEFTAVFLLIFSFFNIDLKYYVKEILISVIIVTFVSYLLVISDLYHYIPVPLVIIGVIILLFVKVFKIQKLIYAAFISIGGSIIYGLIQFSVLLIFVHYNLVPKEAMNDSFSTEAYIVQSICSSTAVLISIYIKIFNGGFGFVFRKEKYSVFTVISIFFVVFMSASGYAFYYNHEFIFIITLFFIITLLIYVSFALKREKFEFPERR